MSPDSQRLQHLILARLADRPRRPLTLRNLRDDLGAFVAHALTAGQWNAALERAMAELEAAGHIAHGPLRLTEAGRQRLQRLLGVDTLPAWKEIRDVHLPALALDLIPLSPRARQRIRDAEGLRGAIVKHHHRLPFREAPTRDQALDALVCRLLGMDPAGGLTLNKLRAHVLRQLLDADARVPLARLKQLVPARALDLATTDARALRPALVRAWLWQRAEQAEPGAEAPAPAWAPPGAIEAAHRVAGALGTLPADGALEALAQRVVALAARTEQGRFDDHKVFVSAVWRQIRHEPVCAGMDLDRFKARLLEAHQRALLRLCHADLIAAMDPAEVAGSAIPYLNTTFHFVEVRRQP